MTREELARLGQLGRRGSLFHVRTRDSLDLERIDADIAQVERHEVVACHDASPVIVAE